ncbi:mannitol dehydrogenase family protein [Fluviibacterium sp. DFM31]|uniref:Mannitol dehydrogenase family protein n=1 Tax=Meridianimarinicoccus marinus TaxID=3231483 RepID=A0ABV3L5P8_9RHOB
MPADPEALPRLTRSGPAPRPGIVHLGLGAFFRAHGAVYLDDALSVSGGDWGIIGISLRSPGTRDALLPQGGVYTAVARHPEGAIPRLVNSVVDVRVAPEDPEAVLAVMSDPAIRIVTLTVTEKGYCHAPSTGRLNLDHPDIRYDLGSRLPISAPGVLVRALERRWQAGLAPFTVLSCDNLPENGRIVRGVVLDLARAIDPDLADWIADEGRFPSSMVDRIVPATRPEDIAALAKATGRHDAAPVIREPFRQWVIEDDFVEDARPDLAAVGVQMVADVTPFEHMKLRMLNGTHSALAYLGYLAGHQTIADTMGDPVFRTYVQALWQDEIQPALSPPPGQDLTAYARALQARYTNPAIRHRTWQIAMDGSQKLPQRILATLAENRTAGRACPGLILAVAGWMRYVGGVDEAGQPIDVRDPLAAQFAAISGAATSPAETVAGLLALREVFNPGLAASIAPELTQVYDGLIRLGARKAIAALA